MPSDVMARCRLDPGLVQRRRPEELRHLTGARALTDGQSYYAVSPELLEPPAAPETMPEHVRRIEAYYAESDTFGEARRAQEVLAGELDRMSLIYGDVSARAVFGALQRIQACRSDRFLDLGCGCGLPVLVASRVVGTASGVDLLPGVIDFCRRASSELGVSNASFEVRDLLSADLSGADILFVAGTAFSNALRTALRAKLLEARPGCVIVSVTHNLESWDFLLADTMRCEFPWLRGSRVRTHVFYFHLRR